MGQIPRRLKEADVKGLVYILDMGTLAYAEDDDKEKLIALGQIFRAGIARGAYIIEPGSYPQPRAGITTNEEKSTLEVLANHLFANHTFLLSTGDLWEKRIALLKELNEKKEQIFTRTLEQINRILARLK